MGYAKATGTPEPEQQPFVKPANDAPPMGPSGSSDPPGSVRGGRGFGGDNRRSDNPFEPSEDLKLTEDQKQKWKTAAEFSKAAWDDAREQREWSEFQGIRNEFRKEIEKFLKADQLTKFDELRSRGRESGGRNRGERPSNPSENNRTGPSPSDPVEKQD